MRESIGYLVYLQSLSLIIFTLCLLNFHPLVDLCLSKVLDDLGSVDDASVAGLSAAEGVSTLLYVVVTDEVGLGDAVKRSVA